MGEVRVVHDECVTAIKFDEVIYITSTVYGYFKVFKSRVQILKYQTN